MEVAAKLAVLADAAKYDVSCASSGGNRRSARDGGAAGAIGSVTGAGICHSYAPDGRCISLLKVLLTNSCIFDCRYCINRRSSNVQRARFRVEELVELTMSFYRRNYIEGLFLSSGIIRNSDYTMEQINRVARSVRRDHGFRGYIHLKAIPDAAPELLAEAGRWADRLSLNVELPREEDLGRLAPEKSAPAIRGAMAQMHERIAEGEADQRAAAFAPAGQSTQMIVGADASSDADVLGSSASLYRDYALKRVYYSAFSPIPDSHPDLPGKPVSMWREHRLCQADWLIRFYGFAPLEITKDRPNGMLDLDADPKLAWALANRADFPVDVNRADRDMLLRVPGFGVRGVDRLLDARRHRRLRLDDLYRLGLRMKTAAPFIVAGGGNAALRHLDMADLRTRLVTSVQPAQEQLSLLGGHAA